MAIKERHIIDTRMLELIDVLKTIGAIESRQEFLDVIGMAKQNFTKIVAREMSFTLKQVTNACLHYDVNANWLMGIEPKLFRDLKQHLKQKQ